MKKAVYITKTNCITPLGFDVASNIQNISAGVSGIQLHQNNNLQGKNIMQQQFLTKK